ncbi:Glucosamine-phosphate N-acetyltransferase-like protein [Mycoblastus sanguinarius]|nr:Glucosamine-phosphate N-acetyltransferase-like protein [Mycoblastus sanguinarius]
MWSSSAAATGSKNMDPSTRGPLFSSSLISEDVKTALPERYTMRPLKRTDYKSGILDVLRVLTTVGDISEEEWTERYDWMAKRGDEYYILVVCDGEGKIVGTGCVMVERKFIHNLGLVGHIEDIVVNKDQQGKKLGLRIIEALDHIAEEVGCYKPRLSMGAKNLEIIYFALCFPYGALFVFQTVVHSVHRPPHPLLYYVAVKPAPPQVHPRPPETFTSLTPTLTSTLAQTILDCSETNEGFYVKCGYKRAGLEMSH